MRRSITFLLSATFLAAAGCDSSTSPVFALHSAHARWAGHEPDSYAYVQRLSCYCPPGGADPVRVVVKNSVVQSRTYVATGLAVPPASADRYPTIDNIFQSLEAAVHNGTPPFILEFDRSLGFPSHYAFDDPALDAPEFFVTAFEVLSQ